VTQNVDDLHERAGSRDVLHVHGLIWRLRCTADGSLFEDRRVPLPEIPPRCRCGAFARPDVVWFGETLETTVVQTIDALVREPFDVVLVVGTEATFGYIRDWARHARSGGALLVEVNPRATELTPDVDGRLEGTAAEILPSILCQ